MPLNRQSTNLGAGYLLPRPPAATEVVQAVVQGCLHQDSPRRAFLWATGQSVGEHGTYCCKVKHYSFHWCLVSGACSSSSSLTLTSTPETSASLVRCRKQVAIQRPLIEKEAYRSFGETRRLFAGPQRNHVRSASANIKQFGGVRGREALQAPQTVLWAPGTALVLSQSQRFPVTLSFRV